jgi:hypothetical protein
MKLQNKVHWWDGLYLSPEHLQEEHNNLSNSIKNLKYILNNYITVNHLEINQLLLTRGIIEILNFEGMFPNMDYIQYNSEEIINKKDKIYPIKEDINKYNKIINENGGLLIYLTISDEVVYISEEINNIKIEKVIPKLIITNENSVENLNKSIPILRIINKNGNLIMDEEYIPPMVFIKQSSNFYKEIEEFIKFLRNTAMMTAGEFFTRVNNLDVESILNKMNYFLKYNSLMPEILVLESLLLNKGHPKDIFVCFQKIIGGLSLLRFTNLPSLQIYNHEDIYKSLMDLMNLIKMMLENLQSKGDSMIMKLIDNKFSLEIPMDVFTPLINTYLFIELNNEKEKNDAINWIEEAKIYGKGFDEIINLKRVRGLERKILNKILFGNQIIIVELNMNSEFLQMTNNILYINNSISNYMPKNILLSWRSEEI